MLDVQRKPLCLKGMSPKTALMPKGRVVSPKTALTPKGRVVGFAHLSTEAATLNRATTRLTLALLII